MTIQNVGASLTPQKREKSSDCQCSCHEPQDEVTLSSKMSAEDAEYFRLLDIERAKPDWENSQARQAWLHWG